MLRLAGTISLALASLGGLSGEAAEPSAGRSAEAHGHVLPAPAAVPAGRKASTVAVIRIEGPIDQVTSRSVQRRIGVAQDIGADAIVFELHTPGGMVGPSLEICNAIKNSPVPNTVAWVNTEAYSAGTFIALACREIVTAPYATMGDAAPIAMMPGLGLKSMSETERQKILAPLFSEMVDSARRRGYDEKLVQGFVSLGVELWEVEEISTGRRLFIDEAEHRTLFGEEPERPTPRLGQPARAVSSGPKFVPAPMTGAEAGPAGKSGPGATAFKPASPGILPETSAEVSGSLDRLSERPQFSAGDRGRWRLVEYTTSGASLLVLKTEEMQRYGFSQATIKSDEDLRAYFGASTIRRFDESWSESLMRFFSGMIVRGILITVFLIAMFVEMAAPGVSVAGGIAGLCLIGLLAPTLLVGASGWWTVAAVLVGVGLILAELLVFPGTLFLGATGLLLLFGGLVGTFVTAESGRTGEEIVHGVAIVLLSVFVAGLAMYFIGKAYGTFPVFNRLILTGTNAAEDEGRGLLAAMAPTGSEGALPLGVVGTALTDLRPAGTAEFDGRIVDVVSEVGFVDRGTRVRTVAVTAYRVGVEPADGPEARA